jgi:hypothetical protein
MTCEGPQGEKNTWIWTDRDTNFRLRVQSSSPSAFCSVSFRSFRVPNPACFCPGLLQGLPNLFPGWEWRALSLAESAQACFKGGRFEVIHIFLGVSKAMIAVLEKFRTVFFNYRHKNLKARLNRAETLSNY